MLHSIATWKLVDLIAALGKSDYRIYNGVSTKYCKVLVPTIKKLCQSFSQSACNSQDYVIKTNELWLVIFYELWLVIFFYIR